MDAKSTEMIPLKVLVDKEKNRVVFAESDKDFVDVLFSFLTLPMATIVRLMSKEKSEIGCMNTLYKAVKDLSVRHFEKKKHTKSQLLNPKNPLQAQCRKLKLNIDDTKLTRYFVCEDCYNGPNALVKNFLKICECGKLMKKMYLAEDYDGNTDVESKEGVFVKETSLFIVTDDLQVVPATPITILELFGKLGVRDFNSLEERMVYVRLQEVSSLLRLSLLSKTPLTDLVLATPLASEELVLHLEDQAKPQKAIDTLSHMKNIALKLMVRKSDGKVMYAEAESDFVNYLFILLAVPVGSMVKLMDRNLSLGCICNIYKSVEDLSVDKYMKSEDLKAKLLSPKLGIQVSCRGLTETKMRAVADDECITVHPNPKSSVFKNLDLPALEALGERKTVKGPVTYLVTDDLVVTPLFQVSSISMLGSLKVPMTDLDVQVVSFGMVEAQKLLEASLISKSALTFAFNTTANEEAPKVEERLFPPPLREWL